MRRLPIALLLLPLCAAASSPPAEPQPVLEPMTDGMLVNRYGGELEVRLDADFNGDGDPDTAAVMRDDEKETRRLVVAVGYRSDVDMGYDNVGEMAMDPYPLGNASLSVKKNVLIVEDLAGGTSAVSSTYRFRLDPAENRMRLIGDDVTYYSRTHQHDRVDISTNRLTGQRIRQVFELTGEDYTPKAPVKETVAKTAIYMEEAPRPDVTLGLETAE